MYQKITIKGVEQNYVKRLADNVFVPLEAGNKDYHQYLKWIEEGNTPLPSDEPAPQE
jgi:hypothetical protein